MRTLPLRAPGRPIPPAPSLTALAAGVLLVLGVAAPVLAHSELVSSDPADKAVLASAPTAVTLNFSEQLVPSGSSFKLLGPAGTVGTGKVGAVNTQMLLSGLALAPGDYTIQWTSVATDQDLLRGTLTFTVSPSAASVGAPTPALSPAGSAAPFSSNFSTNPAPEVVLSIVVGLVLVAFLGLYLLSRRVRS
jgi:methionine-rich copper-binding protein CopC